MRRGSWAVHQSTKTESDVLTVPFNLQPFHVFNNHPRRGGAAVARVPAAAEEVASPPPLIDHVGQSRSLRLCYVVAGFDCVGWMVIHGLVISPSA